MEFLAQRVARLLAQNTPAVREPALRFFSPDVAADGALGGVYALPDYTKLAVQQSVPLDQDYGTGRCDPNVRLGWNNYFRVGDRFLFVNLWTLDPCGQRDLLPGESPFYGHHYLDCSNGQNFVRIHNGPSPGVIRFRSSGIEDVDRVRHVPLTDLHAFTYMDNVVTCLCVCNGRGQHWNLVSLGIDDMILKYGFRSDGAVFVQTHRVLMLLK